MDESFDWRLAFIRTYLERDIPQFGSRIPAETLRRFWTMLAHDQGQTHNAAALARGLDVGGVAVAKYLDLMVDHLLIRRLVPWTTNLGRRLVKAPKVYVRDSGVCHALLGIETMDDLFGHPVIGGSWEGFRHREYRRCPAGPRIMWLLPHFRRCGSRPGGRSRRGRAVGDRDQAQLRAPRLQRIPQRLPGPSAGPQVRRSRRQRKLPAREGDTSGELACDHRFGGAVRLSAGTCGLGAGRRPMGGPR